VPVDREHLEWALRKEKGEHVSMSSFAEEFEYYDRESAERDYKALIKATELDSSRRTLLRMSFESFNANRSANFWSKRSASHQARVSVNEAASDSIKVGRQVQAGIFRQLQDKEKQSRRVESTPVYTDRNNTDAVKDDDESSIEYIFFENPQAPEGPDDGDSSIDGADHLPLNATQHNFNNAHGMFVPKLFSRCSAGKRYLTPSRLILCLYRNHPKTSS